MFCTQCGKEIREGFKFCTNCGAAVKGAAPKSDAVKGDAVKIEPKTTVTETHEVISHESSPAVRNRGNRLHVGLIVFMIVILCGAFWFLGGRDLILDVVGISDSKKATDDIDNLHINNTEEAEDDIDPIEEIEDQESDFETAEEEEMEDNDAEAEEIINPDESMEAEEEAEEVVEEASEYILENSDSQYLTKADLVGMTAEECRLARNELYARHGRKFDDEMLQSYFEACSWYHGMIDASDFQESMLNDIEIANRDLIVEYEKEMGYR